jgi:hypothetical protein
MAGIVNENEEEQLDLYGPIIEDDTALRAAPQPAVPKVARPAGR